MSVKQEKKSSPAKSSNQGEKANSKKSNYSYDYSGSAKKTTRAVYSAFKIAENAQSN